MKPSLAKRLSVIEERNKRVEQDKAWETSLTRRLSIAGLTYVVVVIYLMIIGNDRPFINAFVPPIGFFLSTLVMHRIRQFGKVIKIRESTDQVP